MFPSKLYHATGISIHALHEESDMRKRTPVTIMQFQSTLSMRRATHEFIYLRRTDVISIHALHEESDVAEHGERVTV